MFPPTSIILVYMWNVVKKSSFIVGVNSQARKRECKRMESLVAVGGEGLRRRALAGGALLGIGQLAGGNLLALVVSGALGLSSLLQAGNNILVLPANLVAQTADSAVLAAGLQTKNAEGLGNDHLLLLVVRGRDTLEDLETLKGGGTTGSLVGNHATDGLVEDSGGSTEVEGTTTGRVETGGLAEVGVVLELSAEELARDVESLSADNDDLLTLEELLGDNTGQTAEQVALAIDNDLLTNHSQYSISLVRPM